MQTRYRIIMPGNIEFPEVYKNIIDTYCTIGKLFKSGSYKYLLIHENGKLFRKCINPRYKEVDEYTFIKGFWSDGFVLDDGSKQYYIKP